MIRKFCLLCAPTLVFAMSQAPQVPNVDAQRAAMRKLSFLIGAWSGSATRWLKPDSPSELTMTEQATYKLEGLLLTIEGVGAQKADGKPVLQAFGVVSYDDASGTYRMRAFNDGRWLESDVTVDEARKELHWGFTIGQIRTKSTLRINDKGEWTEVHELTIGSNQPWKFMELAVKRQP